MTKDQKPQIMMKPKYLQKRKYKKLQNGKAADEDDIVAELIRFRGAHLHREIFLLIEGIWAQNIYYEMNRTGKQ